MNRQFNTIAIKLLQVVPKGVLKMCCESIKVKYFYDFRTKDMTSMSLMFLVYFRTISLLSPSPSGRSNF